MSLVEGPVPMETGTMKFGTPEKVITASSSREQSHDTYPSRPTYDEDTLDEFIDMDEDCLVGEATVLNTKEAKRRVTMIEAPALPPKSRLRASRLLETLKLSSIESATQSLTTPHDMYLSSEEDASSSADDFSDYGFGSENESAGEASPKSPVRRRSHEVTARVVSVIFSGKPSIVNLPCRRRSMSPVSTAASPQSTLYGTSSSGSSTSESSSSVDSLPLRKSNLTLRTYSGPQPTFLSTDPCQGNVYSFDGPQQERLDGTSSRAPKTPTAVFNRAFNLVTKRSRPMLRTSSMGVSRDSVLSTGSTSTLNLSLRTTTPSSEQPDPLSYSPAESATPVSPATYGDVMRFARKNASTLTKPQPQPQSATSPKRSLLSSFSLSKRRSLKA